MLDCLAAAAMDRWRTERRCRAVRTKRVGGPARHYRRRAVLHDVNYTRTRNGGRVHHVLGRACRNARKHETVRCVARFCCPLFAGGDAALLRAEPARFAAGSGAKWVSRSIVGLVAGVAGARTGRLIGCLGGPRGRAVLLPAAAAERIGCGLGWCCARAAKAGWMGAARPDSPPVGR
jgi:hypothetical protein